MPLVKHYLWAGLDFMIDADGVPVLLEANKSSHMLGEYLVHYGDERPFQRIAARMNATDGPPVCLWRRCDPVPQADEDIAFITRHLSVHLRETPLIALVEENRDLDRIPWGSSSASAPTTPETVQQRTEVICRDGQRVRPGSIFRWWYDAPWAWERSGALVINSNGLWLACRDKFTCAQHVMSASKFRVPWSLPVDSAEEAEWLIEQHMERFAAGYVLKPRVGWGGYGVQVASPGEPPRRIGPGYLLSERVRPAPRDGAYWDIRAFVMDGEFVGGLIHTSTEPNTNYWQGGRPAQLDEATARLIAPAAEEAVLLLDEAAERIHRQPVPHDHPLLRVEY